ncbi:MAG: hypothetical protein ACXABV_12660 [Candidatus Thorarchaeota archaeon]|jgi:hypothetical protein
MRRYLISAISVAVSVFIAPIAEVSWASMIPELHDRDLYFVWGRYSFGAGRVYLYGMSATFPYHFESIAFLVLFWIASGMLLVVTIVLASKSERYALGALLTGIGICAAQILLPGVMFGSTIEEPMYGTVYTMPLPVAPMLAIALQGFLFFFGRRDIS